MVSYTRLNDMRTDFNEKMSEIKTDLVKSIDVLKQARAGKKPLKLTKPCRVRFFSRLFFSWSKNPVVLESKGSFFALFITLLSCCISTVMLAAIKIPNP